MFFSQLINDIVHPWISCPSILSSFLCPWQVHKVTTIPLCENILECCRKRGGMWSVRFTKRCRKYVILVLKLQVYHIAPSFRGKKLPWFLEFCSKIKYFIIKLLWSRESVIHPCLVWLNICEKIFVIPFRVTKIMKIFYLKSLELYGSKSTSSVCSHEWSGCDTTSATFQQGKTTVLKKMRLQ